jgi:nitrite reductase/ring-hydroxylating ferredoxin subunit
MQQERQIELVRRIQKHIEAKTTDSDATGVLLDAAEYMDDARTLHENAILFKTWPVMVAHGASLPHPGDFITHDASGTPLLVVRRDDGGVDAFINVCRHRGTRVEGAPGGNKRAFSCPYHGWTYGKRGQLVTIPHERGFACIDKASRGLVRVPAGEGSGLVFVRPSPATREESLDLPVRALLGEIAEDLDGFGIGAGALVEPQSKERALSWKLAIDIFLESYHLRTAHKDTIYPMFFDNLGLVDRIGPNLRNLFPKRTIRELAGSPPESWELRKHANILYHLFPNTLLLVEPDHAAILNVWPVSAGRSRVDACMLVPEAPTTDKARAYWKANADILYGATEEDFDMGVSIQSGLRSGANRDVVFGAFEHALAHFHAQIENATRSPTTV